MKTSKLLTRVRFPSPAPLKPQARALSVLAFFVCAPKCAPNRGQKAKNAVTAFENNRLVRGCRTGLFGLFISKTENELNSRVSAPVVGPPLKRPLWEVGGMVCGLHQSRIQSVPLLLCIVTLGAFLALLLCSYGLRSILMPCSSAGNKKGR